MTGNIVGIAKVNRATAIYTDDDNLINCAEFNGIKTILLKDIALPDKLKQFSLFDSRTIEERQVNQNPVQSDKFVETARSLECDKSAENFDKKLKEIVQVKAQQTENEQTG